MRWDVVVHLVDIGEIVTINRQEHKIEHHEHHDRISIKTGSETRCSGRISILPQEWHVNSYWQVRKQRSHTEWRRLHTIKFRVVIPATRIAWRNQRGNPSVNRRRTDNTMAKRKTTKGKTTVQNPTHKTKDRVTRTPPKTGGELRCSDVKRCSILLCPLLFVDG